MPVKVNEFVIQAKFDDSESHDPGQSDAGIDVLALKEEIIKECLEKVERLLDRKINR
ncbi:MAG: DUF5908 family protein [Bacteroidota bacterium]